MTELARARGGTARHGAVTATVPDTDRFVGLPAGPRLVPTADTDDTGGTR